MPKNKPLKKKQALPRNETMRKKDYEALAVFRYALRKFFKFSEEAARQAGLSMRQYQALLTICGFPAREQITMGEMAEWLQIKHHSAVGLVDRLESQKLVFRQRSKEDKRRVFICTTNKGKRILEKLAWLNKQQLKKLRPAIQQMSELLSLNQ
jgi:DNA-binding MarR family transcriptional regulator